VDYLATDEIRLLKIWLWEQEFQRRICIVSYRYQLNDYFSSCIKKEPKLVPICCLCYRQENWRETHSLAASSCMMSELTRVSALLPPARSLWWRLSVRSGRHAPTLSSNNGSSLRLYLRLPLAVTSGSNASARCNNQIVSSRIRNMTNFDCPMWPVQCRKCTTGHFYSWLHEHVSTICPSHYNDCPLIY
jgi:hypothetical protein